MPGKRRPDYEAFISQPGKDGGKPFYQKIGAAWLVSSDGISIKLNAFPVEGSLVLFPRKDDKAEDELGGR